MKNLLSLSIALVVGIAACSSTEDPAPTNDAQAVEVNITANTFTPAQVRIKVGQTVRWNWRGGSHNVVSGTDCAVPAGDGKFRSGAEQSGGTFERKFDVAGSFPYFCEPHCTMGMKGEVIVE